MGKISLDQDIANKCSLDTGEAYRDMEGNMKQFSSVDWDSKLTKNMGVTTKGEYNEIRESLKDYRLDLIQRVLDIPASLCPLPFQDFTVRGESITKIPWNETMIKDPGLDISRLRDLCILLENRAGINPSLMH